MLLTAILRDTLEPSTNRHQINPSTNSALRQEIPKSTHEVRAGRVSMANFPPEYELAQLVRNVGNLHSTWKTSTPACKWDGVDCNEADEIKCINWSGISQSDEQLTGSLSFGYIPKTLHTFNVFVTNLSGEVPLNILPCELRCLVLRNNELSGSLDLTSLPPNLRNLDLSANRFTGEVCLTKLPLELKYLCLDRNQLSGKLYLNNLPNLSYLRLYENNFSGNVDIEVRSIPIH